LTSRGYNLIGNANGTTINGTTIGNILGQDPLLSPLSSNGGPTQTHLLCRTARRSTLGDPNNILANDQRDFTRPRDGDGDGSAVPDIGALEMRPVPVINTNSGGAGSLKQAIADVLTTGDAVVFSGNLFNTPQVITLTDGEIAIPGNANFTISGPGNGKLAVCGNNTSRVFNIGAGSRITISDLTISGGNGARASSNGTGGGIYINAGSRVTLANSTITGNTSSSTLGGGIYNLGILTVNNSNINYNSAPINGNNLTGGGIYNFSGTLTINNSTINNNSTVGNGFNANAHGGGSTTSTEY
jgi:hypothetical protein